MKKYWLALLILVAPLLTCCTDLVDQDQVQVRTTATTALSAENPVGQTFVSHHAGLNGIDFYLRPSSDSNGTVHLHLRSNQADITDIRETHVPLARGSREGFYNFSFTPLSDSHTRYYYVFLEFEGTGEVKVPTGQLGAYADGVLYSGHEPRESQTAFRLHYAPLRIAADLARTALRWIGFGIGGLAILFFGGYWITRRWARGRDFSATLVISSLGFLASWMVFLIWVDLFRVALGPPAVRGLTGGSVLLGLACFARDRERWRAREFWLGHHPVETVALWLVVVVSLALRLFVGRSMVMLPGSDTYHQTLIAQLFSDQGGIPHTYEPYAPLQSFSYHFGFHSVVALVRWILDSDLLVTTKNVALILNGAIAGAVALLGEEVAGRRLGGIVASAFVGLIAVSPACLLQYGRFTQTTGLLFLTAGAWILLAGRSEHGGWILPSLLVAAITFSHYRAALYWAVLAVVVIGPDLLARRWDRVAPWLVAGASTLVLVAPWMLNVGRTQLDRHGLQANYPYLSQYQAIARLGDTVLRFPTNGLLVVLLLPLMTVKTLKKSQRNAARALAGWCLLLGSGAAVSALAGFYFWDVKTMLLSLPIPLAALAGLGAESLRNIGTGARRAVIRVAFTATVLVGILVGGFNQPSAIRSGALYLRPGYAATMDWMKDNLPRDAFVLANGIQFDWSPGWIVGSDAGYWIPLLTDRFATPPAMTYRLEWGPSPNWFEPLQQLHQTILESGGTRAPTARQLESGGITHIYADERRGPLRPHVLDEASYLTPIHRQDTAWIFQVTR